MRLLHLDNVPAEDCAEALRSALLQGVGPCHVEIARTADDPAQARVDLWRLGRSSFMATDAPAIRLSRTARHCRVGTAEVVSLSIIRPRGRAWRRQFGHDQLLRPGDLILDDMAAPEEFETESSLRSHNFLVTHEELGLPIDLIHQAALRLPASPLYRLVHGHLLGLSAQADEVLNGPAATGVARATTELVRALIATAVDGSPYGGDAMADTLLTRALAYARQHLRERDLTPARLAAAQHVSVRHLFSVCARAGVSLEQWIIIERLAGARAELASPVGQHRSVAGIAHRWGFTSASHFSRRFRDAYGVSPSTWQRDSLSTVTSDSAPMRSPPARRELITRQ